MYGFGNTTEVDSIQVDLLYVLMYCVCNFLCVQTGARVVYCESCVFMKTAEIRNQSCLNNGLSVSVSKCFSDRKPDKPEALDLQGIRRPKYYG